MKTDYMRNRRAGKGLWSRKKPDTDYSEVRWLLTCNSTNVITALGLVPVGWLTLTLRRFTHSDTLKLDGPRVTVKGLICRKAQI